MEVVKGYKLTELGVIPNDWEVKELGDIGEVKMCRRIFNSETTSSGSVPFFKIGTFGKEPDAYISQELYNKYRKRFSFPKKGDILISAAGTIGRTIIYDGADAYYQDSNIVWIDNENSIVSNDFLYHIYQVAKYNTEGGTIQRLYNSILKKTKFACPSKREQTAIATALSDTDALISSIEKLIAKKRNIKQGAMQQLLKPKKGWEVKRLGDCLLQNPDYGINAASVPHKESLPTYLRITDISEDGRYLANDKVSVDNTGSGAFYLDEGDIVFARTGASVGKTYLYDRNDGELVFAGFLIRIKTNKSIIDPKYLFYFTQTKQYWSWVLANSMRSGQPGLNSNEFKSLPICIPTIEVQREIISVLSLMDSEIAVLESKLEKFRQIKSGMMQNLLTGKIRLV